MNKKFNLLFIIMIIIVLASCNSKYVDYMDNFKGYDETIGTKTNNESVEDLVRIYSDNTISDLKVLKTHDIDDDYIFGVDISSIIQVEENGGVFYDELGRERDVFEILKEKGINYVRIRHWNNPKDKNGKYFGGGNNDLTTNIEIAKRAKRVGMRISLDFHYSDFWADPGKQSIPRAWKDLSENDLKKALYKYTYDTLKSFEKAGVRPHMVQIGNEINNGFLYPVAPASRGFGRIADFITEGINAVHDVSPDIKTVIHLAEGASLQTLTNFFDRMIQNDVSFDIIGVSYYSFWHGTLEQFKETLEVLDKRYEQDIAVMEYSYGFTTLSADNANHIFNEDLASLGGYAATMQGQVSYIRDVNDVVLGLDKGIGSFYWEPAWLPIKGAGWASEPARDYLAEQGDSLSGGLVSWANQALFSFTGKALPSINVFNEMKTSTFTDEEIITYDNEVDVTLNIRSSDESLPKTIRGYTNLDRIADIAVTWNEEDINNMLELGEGNYEINGTIKSGNETLPVTANVVAFENYIENPGFEKGGKVGADVTNFNDVPNWNVIQTIDRSVKIESKNPRGGGQNGFNNINLYSTHDYTFTLYQEVLLTPGNYLLSAWGRSADSNNSGVPNVSLFAEFDEIDTLKTVLYGSGWSDWVLTTLSFTITEESIVKVGIKGNGKAESWAHFDDFSLQMVRD